MLSTSSASISTASTVSNTADCRSSSFSIIEESSDSFSNFLHKRLMAVLRAISEGNDLCTFNEVPPCAHAALSSNAGTSSASVLPSIYVAIAYAPAISLPQQPKSIS